MSESRGAALPAAMLAVLAFAVVIAGTYALLRVQVRETVYQVRLAQAQAIAEAGLEDALGQISLKPSWKTGYAQRNFAGGYYTVTCSTDVVNRWITSTGYSENIAVMGRAVRTVKAQSISDGFYNFADSTFTVGWPITSFDSVVDKTPTCRTTNMNLSGCIAGPALWANTTVLTSGTSVQVNGDVTYATPSSTAPAQATIAGSIILETSTTTVDIADGTPYITANDNLGIGRITPASAYDAATGVLSVTTTTGNVSLSSGTYYFKGMFISSRTLTISMRSGQEMFIYLAGSLYVSPQGMIDSNQSRYACDQHIYGQGGSTITLSGYTAVNNAANTTYLDIYAPQDRVVLFQRMLGRLIGKEVIIANPYGAANNRPIFFFDVQCGYAQAKGTRWVSGTWSESYWKP
jgi:hypothetical protein